MAAFDKKKIHQLSLLSRLHCNEEEEIALSAELEKIINYVALLQEEDTQNIQPCHHVLSFMQSIMREDIPEQTLDRETYLSNSPDKIGGMVKVPPVLKKEKA